MLEILMFFAAGLALLIFGGVTLVLAGVVAFMLIDAILYLIGGK